MRFKQTKKIILASGSPRRKAYLERYQFDFEIRKAGIDESSKPGEEPLEFASRMAEEKAGSVSCQELNGSVIIAADTIVVYEGEILGKPNDRNGVLPMLKKLNGKTHEVITAYVILDPADSTKIRHYVRTEVTFKTLPDELLQAYAASEEPLDKAGAYSIQGNGTFLVESIKGSYNNVVGLPIEVVLQDLIKLKAISTISE